MKAKSATSWKLKKMISIVLALSLILTSMPSAFLTPVFAEEDMQKGRFLIVYEKGEEKKPFSFPSVFSTEGEEEKKKLLNGRI